MANSPSGESVLDRVMRLLDVLEAETRLSPSSLARQAGLPKSTAYRLLEDLTRRGILQRDSAGNVELGRRLWEMAQHTSIAGTLRQAALPHMQDLNAAVGQTCQLAVLDEAEVLIVERLSRIGAVDNPAEVASRMPVHLTSMGHVLLAFSPYVVSQEIMHRQARRIAAERPELRSEIAETRRRGYASLDGLIHAGTTGTSVPILDERGIARAVLTVVAPNDPGSLHLRLVALQAAARGIARDLLAEDSQEAQEVGGRELASA